MPVTVFIQERSGDYNKDEVLPMPLQECLHGKLPASRFCQTQSAPCVRPIRRTVHCRATNGRPLSGWTVALFTPCFALIDPASERMSRKSAAHMHPSR